MANSAANVRLAPTGALYIDTTNAGAAPTTAVSAVAGAFKEMGYAAEDSVSMTHPDTGDATPIKAWQNSAQVRVVRSSSDDSPQLSLTLIETKLDVIQAVFGVTVTQGVTDGSFTFDASALRAHVKAILDIVDGAETIRIYAPYAIVSSIGEIPLTGNDAIGYEITLDLERDPTLAYNYKRFDTALKTP